MPTNEIVSFYTGYNEASRLQRGVSLLECARSRELILRHFPTTVPAVVLDIGGAAGAYSFWLAELGHQVHLLDLTEKHIAQARERARDTGLALASMRVGDACALPFPGDFADVALLMGPLYHLQDRAQRLQAFAEALRVLKPGGVFFASAIGRHATLLDGFVSGFIGDPTLFALMQDELRDGCHHCPPGMSYFTTAFLHRPEELRVEAEQAGLQHIELFALESFGAMLPDFAAKWEDPAYRELLLQSIRLVETDPSLLGISQHLMLVGWKTQLLY